MIKIAPSILSADFIRLKEQIAEVEAAGAEVIHIDVMDGHFVPNLTFGPFMVAALRPITNLILDVHLMIENPDQYIPEFAKAGADVITVHEEASTHLYRSLQLIKSLNCKAGVSLNPATHESVLEYVINDIDLLLIMSVNPGFGGQSFIDSALQKIECVKAMKQQHNADFVIEVDGGVSPKNAEIISKAGAEWLVAGSAVFKADSIEKGIKDIRAEALKAHANG